VDNVCVLRNILAKQGPSRALQMFVRNFMLLESGTRRTHPRLINNDNGVFFGRELMMNKKYLLAGFFAASLGTTSIATAGAGDTYASFSLGSVSQDASGLDVDDTIGWKISGGYALNDVLAIEGGYISFGDADLTMPGFSNVSSSIETTGFEVATVGNFPLNSEFSLLGKVGLLFWDGEISASGPGGFASASVTGSDVFFGVGAQYEVAGNLAIRGSWERYAADDIDIDFLSVSAVFGF